MRRVYSIISLVILCIFTLVIACIGCTRGAGAYVTGQYRNLFKEIGKSDHQIKEKIDKAWNQLFYGDNDAQRVFYPTKDSMAYIKDTGSGDVRSEGVSFGMMICVQLNKKKEFDQLWRWAHKYMLHKKGHFKGYFAWQRDENGQPINTGSQTPASDGDEYFAMALFFASHRWGDGQGIYNYKAEANNILHTMLHQNEDGKGWNMFDPQTGLVVFCPIGDAAKHTDPSYHLPGFYELWAQWADKDNARWKDIAKKSRLFLKKTVHKRTGLNPDYARFDGTPTDPGGGGHADFRSDAFRTVMNAAFDYSWWQKDAWQKKYVDTLQKFFAGQGMQTYVAHYTLEGKPLVKYRSGGLIAANAVASLATNTELSAKFVEELWNMPVPSGKWRYYDGMLYMLSMLHVSGNFKIYKPQ